MITIATILETIPHADTLLEALKKEKRRINIWGRQKARRKYVEVFSRAGKYTIEANGIINGIDPSYSSDLDTAQSGEIEVGGVDQPEDEWKQDSRRGGEF